MGERFRPSPQLSTHTVGQYLDTYLTHKYPITPMIDRARIEEYIRNFAQCPGCYGVIVSCCATVAPDRDVSSAPAADSPELPRQRSHCDLSEPSADFLVSEVLRSRRFCHLADNQSLTQVQTSFMLHCAHPSPRNDHAAWFYLREAITILQTLRYHEEATYEETADLSVAREARRAFWVLFVTERAFAIQRHKTLALHSTVDLPYLDPLLGDSEILHGFLDLISLFRPFDAEFITAWNSYAERQTIKPARPPDHEQLCQLQRSLSNCLADVSAYPESQQAELFVTCGWLKTVVWQLCLSVTTLTSTDYCESMSLGYPLSIAQDIVLVLKLLPQKTFAVNRVSILEKLSQVGSSLADVLSLNTPAILRPMTLDASTDILMEIIKIAKKMLGAGCRSPHPKLSQRVMLEKDKY
ncbi:putative sucrose utilization protein SUC1 [Colletotrichum siamense]|nr:putative sucrose utilization protein SUC1 [Colletotrichum siamense]KAF4860297.1 putative sucrose utilization protein SUC1 [Colletotrichum siamense]